MVAVNDYLILSVILFGLGLIGMMINRKNIILLLICAELMLLAVNTNFIIFSNFYSDINGQAFVFFILTVAAAEAAIGLALVMLLYRNKGNIDVDKMNQLKG
jgi:NADH-quinone oxidoreductase subunit K